MLVASTAVWNRTPATDKLPLVHQPLGAPQARPPLGAINGQGPAAYGSRSSLYVNRSMSALVSAAEAAAASAQAQAAGQAPGQQGQGGQGAAAAAQAQHLRRYTQAQVQQLNAVRQLQQQQQVQQQQRQQVLTAAAEVAQQVRDWQHGSPGADLECLTQMTFGVFCFGHRTVFAQH